MTNITSLARVRSLHVAVPRRRSPVDLVARRVTIAPCPVAAKVAPRHAPVLVARWRVCRVTGQLRCVWSHEAADAGATVVPIPSRPLVRPPAWTARPDVAAA
jgi:hypothetical protein